MYISIALLILVRLAVAFCAPLGRLPIDINLPFGDLYEIPSMGGGTNGIPGLQLNLPFSDVQLPMQGLISGLTGSQGNSGTNQNAKPVIQLNHANGTRSFTNIDDGSNSRTASPGGPMSVINMPFTQFRLPLSDITRNPKDLPLHAQAQLDGKMPKREQKQPNFVGNMQGNLATAGESLGPQKTLGMPLSNKLSTSYDIMNFPLNVVELPMAKALELSSGGPPSKPIPSPLDAPMVRADQDVGVIELDEGGVLNLESFSQPYSFLNTPLSYFNLPLSFVNLPFGSTNLPFAHMNLPLGSINPSFTDLFATLGLPPVGRALDQLQVGTLAKSTNTGLPAMKMEVPKSGISPSSPLDNPFAPFLHDSQDKAPEVKTTVEPLMEPMGEETTDEPETAIGQLSEEEQLEMKMSWDSWLKNLHGLPDMQARPRPRPAPSQSLTQANDMIRSIAKISTPGGAKVDQMDALARNLVPSIPEMGGLIGTPFSLFSTPFSLFNMPFGFIDLPMGFLNLPMSHFNLPLASLNMPFTGMNLPFDDINVPDFETPAEEFTVEAGDLPPSLLEVIHGEDPLTSYMNLPLSEMNLPIAVLDMPFSIFDLPFAYSNFPLGHINNPFTHAHLPFELTNLPLSDVVAPFDGLK